MGTILLKLKSIPRLQEIKEEYGLALDEDVKEKKDILKCKDSITGQYLSGEKCIEVPKERRKN